MPTFYCILLETLHQLPQVILPMLVIFTAHSNVSLPYSFCPVPPSHHHPVPMPTVTGRLFRCTGMEAAEMCHHRECRRGEELCVWRDAQRKRRVGCRDVYKGGPSGAQSPRLAQTWTHTHSHTHTLWFQSRVSERRTDWKRSITGSLKSSYQAEPPGTRWTALTDEHWLYIVTNFCHFLFVSCLETVETAYQIRTKGFKTLHPAPRLPLELHCQQLIIRTFGPPLTMATSMDTLPAHLLPLVMEEFPQSLATACVCRAGQREPRLRCVQCGVIEEEEEDCSTLEEDQAQRSFLRTVESLRRSTRWTPPEEVAARPWHVWPIWLPCNQSGKQQMSAVLWMQSVLT